MTTVQHVYVHLCTLMAPVPISHLASPSLFPAPPPPIPAPLSPSRRLPGEVPGERTVAAVFPGEPPVVGVVVGVAPVVVAAAVGPVSAFQVLGIGGVIHHVVIVHCGAICTCALH